jgi:hypothetical protein
VRAERGAGPGLVLDDDGCAKTGLELIGDQAAEKIGGAARRIGHDHLDGSAGIGCLGQRWQSGQHGQSAATSGERRAARQRHRSSQTHTYFLAGGVRSRTTLAATATYRKARKSNTAIAAMQ